MTDLKKDQLPTEWQKLDDIQLKAQIENKQKERAEIQAQIVKLNQERDEYIAAERKKLAASAKGDSFDSQVANAIRTQAARKGIAYEKE